MIGVGVAVSLALLLSGLLFKRSKGLALVQCVWLWGIMAFNCGGMDYDGNESIYLWSGSDAFGGLRDWLAHFIGHICNQFGLHYWQYNAILVSIALLILYRLAMKKTDMPALFFSLVYIYPAMDMVIQKRFFLSMVLCVWGLLLLGEGKRKGCFACLLCACGFHASALVWVAYLLIERLLGRYPWVIPFLLFAEGYVVFFNRSIFRLLPFEGIREKLESYVARNISLKAGILFALVQFVLVCLSVLIERAIRHQVGEGGLRGECEFIERVNIFSLVFIPLLFMDSTFFRYYRTIMVIAYLHIANVMRGRFARNVVKYYYAVAYVGLLALVIVVTTSTGQFGWEGSLSTLFENNVLLDLFGKYIF